jgi:hypothetical protein
VELQPGALAPRFQAAVAALSADLEGGAADAGAVLALSLRAAQELPAAAAQAKATRAFVLSFCADTLARRRDTDGAALLRALAALLRFELPGEGALAGAERDCLRTALRRAADRGWAPPPGPRDEESAQLAPPPDPERAVKDGFAYAVSVFCSRIEAAVAAEQSAAAGVEH